jgi:hypothetical protein
MLSVGLDIDRDFYLSVDGHVDLYLKPVGQHTKVDVGNIDPFQHRSCCQILVIITSRGIPKAQPGNYRWLTVSEALASIHRFRAFQVIGGNPMKDRSFAGKIERRQTKSSQIDKR